MSYRWSDPLPNEPEPPTEPPGEYVPPTADLGLRERLIKAAIKVLVRNARLPEWMQIDALGQDMRPLAELVVDAVLPEVQAWETAAERRGMDAVEKIFDEMWASNEYSDQMKPSMNFAADFAQGVDMARGAVTNP